jgi:hypothetical protein
MTKKEVDRIKYIAVEPVTLGNTQTISLKENEVITKIFVEPELFPTTQSLGIFFNNVILSFNLNNQIFLPFVYEITIKTNKIVFEGISQYQVILEIQTLEEECE